MMRLVLCVAALCLCAAVAVAVPAWSVPLHNAAAPGTMMPTIGLGVGAYGTKPNATFPGGTNGEWWDDASCAVAVAEWLKLGGRRLDTSLKYYHDLGGVGQGIVNSGVPRSEIFVTSKIDNPYGYNTTLEHFSELLATLNSSYVDLLLIHWPGPTFFLGHNEPVPPPFCHTHGPECRQETWKALELIFSRGQAKAIGVANFEQRHVQDILDLNSMVPAVNQIEYHPYWHEDNLAAWLTSKNITLDSYAPLGAPDFMAWQPTKWPVLIPDQPIVKEIAMNVSRTPAQVLLQWNMQRGFVINPRTNKPEHMAENLDLFSPKGAFTLTDEQVDAIANVPHPVHNKVCPDPAVVP